MNLKEAKLYFVVEAATRLFLERGIAAVTIHDIAQEVGVGEATVYRYFSKKQNLVVACAQRLEQTVLTQYFDLSHAEDGQGKMAAFYRGYLAIFDTNPEFYRFISEFDASLEGDEDLTAYEAALVPFFTAYQAAYRLGVEQGTLREVGDVALFYLTTTHALMGLCKKLATDGAILAQDVYGRREIETLIDVIMAYLRA